MVEQRIAHRYAKALYELGEERKTTERLLDEMRSIQKVVKENRQLAAVISSPVITSEKKQKVLDLILKDFSKDILTFIDILATRHREGLLPYVAVAYIELYNKAHNQTPALLTSAETLPQDVVDSIVKQVEQKLKTKLLLETRIDASVIGGFRIKVDQYEWDTTVTSQLAEIKKQFLDPNLIVKVL